LPILAIGKDWFFAELLWRRRNGIARRSTRYSSVAYHGGNKKRTFGVEACSCKEAIMRGFIIGALLVAVGVLGFLYWDSEHNTVFKAPGVEIKKN
jgi:hypothetical protein